jgi:hypothetical protein
MMMETFLIFSGEDMAGGGWLAERDDGGQMQPWGFLMPAIFAAFLAGPLGNSS